MAGESSSPSERQAASRQKRPLGWGQHAAIAGPLAVLFVVVYLWGWGPARSAWITGVAAPVLEAVESATGGDRYAVAARPAAATLVVRRAGESGAAAGRHRAPAGVKFALSGLACVLIAPLRPYWAVVWAGNVVLGACSLAMLAAAVGGADAGFVLSTFVARYVVDAFSLAVPTFALMRGRLGGEPGHE
jgi:hypothetical protein